MDECTPKWFLLQRLPTSFRFPTWGIPLIHRRSRNSPRPNPSRQGTNARDIPCCSMGIGTLGPRVHIPKIEQHGMITSCFLVENERNKGFFPSFDPIVLMNLTTSRWGDISVGFLYRCEHWTSTVCEAAVAEKLATEVPKTWGLVTPSCMKCKDFSIFFRWTSCRSILRLSIDPA